LLSTKAYSALLGHIRSFREHRCTVYFGTPTLLLLWQAHLYGLRDAKRDEELQEI